MIKTLIAILLLSSCSSNPARSFNSDKEFNPYYHNWELNYNYSDKKYERVIPINFTENYPSIVGICVFDKTKSNRKILVNKTNWFNYPDKQERYISHLLNLCYNSDYSDGYKYEIPYYGF